MQGHTIVKNLRFSYSTCFLKDKELMANGYTQFLKKTLKVSLGLMKRRVLKTYGRVELQIYAFLTSTPGMCLMGFITRL